MPPLLHCRAEHACLRLAQASQVQRIAHSVCPTMPVPSYRGGIPLPETPLSSHTSISVAGGSTQSDVDSVVSLASTIDAEWTPGLTLISRDGLHTVIVEPQHLPGFPIPLVFNR